MSSQQRVISGQRAAGKLTSQQRVQQRAAGSGKGVLESSTGLEVGAGEAQLKLIGIDTFQISKLGFLRQQLPAASTCCWQREAVQSAAGSGKGLGVGLD